MNTYINIKALSKLLDIKQSTLYAWAAANKIPCVKIHGLIRFRKEEIDVWLDGFRKKEPQTQRTIFHHKKCDIDSIIAKAKRNVYNDIRGETRPESAQRKEK